MKILITSLLLVSTLFAEIKVGEAFPKLTLVDQFDVKTQINTKGSTTLLLSFEKDVSASIKAYIGSKEKDFLNKNNIMYISDISSMPSFITSMFAIPKMKKFTFSISLIYEEKEAKLLDRKEGKVSVITLKNNIVQTIRYSDAKDLDKVLK